MAPVHQEAPEDPSRQLRAALAAAREVCSTASILLDTEPQACREVLTLGLRDVLDSLRSLPH